MSDTPDTSPAEGGPSPAAVKAAERAKDHIAAYPSEAAPAWPIAAFGGAMSFDEFDDWETARDVENAVQSQMHIFNRLQDNIQQDSSLTAGEKADRILDLASSLPGRLRAAQQDMEETMTGERSYSEPPEAHTDDPGYLQVFRDKSGSWRWIALHSNHFRDKEGEIFSSKAHREWVEYVWKSKAFPTLRLFHVPADFGVADWVGYDDEGFVISSGTFKTDAQDIAETLSQQKNLGCSHGFSYRPQDLVNGVFQRYRTFEVSVLPRAKASNELTAFFAGEAFPVIGQAQREFFVDIVGEERTKAIEEGVAEMASIARRQGISYKAIEDRHIFPEEADADLGVKQPTTKTVDGVALPRSAFADRGNPEQTGTWKLPLQRRPGTMDAGRIRDAITALQPGGFRGQTPSLTDSRSTIIGRIRSAIGQLSNEADRERLTERLGNLRGQRSASEEEADMSDNPTATAAEPETPPAEPEATPPAAEEEETPPTTAEGTPPAAAGEPAGDPAPTEPAAAEPETAEPTAAKSVDPIVSAVLEQIAPGLGIAVKQAVDDAIGEGLKPMTERLEAMQQEITEVKSLAPVVEGLKQTRDQEVASLIYPRSRPLAAVPPSESPSNVISEQNAEGVKSAAGDPEDGPVTMDGRKLHDLPPALQASEPYLGDIFAAMRDGLGAQPVPASNGAQ